MATNDSMVNIGLDVDPQFLALADLVQRIKAQKEEYAAAVAAFEGQAPSVGAVMAQHNERIYATLEQMGEHMSALRSRIEACERNDKTGLIHHVPITGQIREVHQDRDSTGGDEAPR